MYKGLLLLAVIVLAASVGLTCLGYHALAKWAQGLEGARLGEFAEVAEQIRQDVRRKLDEFVRTEQQRPYTDYLHYYVPDNLVGDKSSMPLLRSPLAGQLANGLAYGYFQVGPEDEIITPYDASGPGGQAGTDGLAAQVRTYLENLTNNLLPVIEAGHRIPVQTPGRPEVAWDNANQVRQTANARSKAYTIESLQQQSQKSQFLTQDRSVVASNQAVVEQSRQSAPQVSPGPVPQAPAPGGKQTTPPAKDSTVQIRIEPFLPLVVPGPDRETSIFGGQVFLLRRVQIEDRRLLQGFQLNESQLVAQVQESARRLVREGMQFVLPQTDTGETGPGEMQQAPAYTALLDFGFGTLTLALQEVDPGWIAQRISGLRHVYFGITAVVALAVALALLSLWRATRAQIALVRKKDEFISAVSHELRTPLTSIRMYAEMLDKNWLTSKEKAREYYGSIRQESERLSRLVENVLDFSRLQRGRKRYDFRLGDINACIGDVVAMMRPYAAEHGFRIETDLGPVAEVHFDRDAAAQIVVNLLDNAVKYARSAGDKTIRVRTQESDGFTVIEVEDHGPGVPHRHQKRIFEPFYRCPPQDAGEGSPVAGTGLGLALVRRFAEAHGGFAEVRAAQPRGAIFRVALATRS